MTAGFPEPHCAQNSELMAKVAQSVQCTKVACKKEQMGQTVNSFRSEEEVPLYRYSMCRKIGFSFVIHPLVPLLLAATLICSVTESSIPLLFLKPQSSHVLLFLSPAHGGKLSSLGGREQGRLKHTLANEGNKLLQTSGISAVLIQADLYLPKFWLCYLLGQVSQDYQSRCIFSRQNINK